MKRLRGERLSLAIHATLAASALVACRGAGMKDAHVAVRTVPAAPALACDAASAAESLTKETSGSTLALARVGGRRVVYLADEDAKAILTLDLDTQKPLAETPLDGAPAQVLVGRDGRVFVTLRDKSELVAFAATTAEAPLTRLCGVATPAEPLGIAATPDASAVLVAMGWGQSLAAFDARTLAPRFEAKLPREPRSVVVSDDGKTAFVSHAVGSLMSTVDLTGTAHARGAITLNGFDAQELRGLESARRMLAEAGGALPSGVDEQIGKLEKGRPSCQGFALAKSTAVAGRIFAPEVVVDTGNFEERPDGYGKDGQPTEAPAVAVIDEGTAKPLLASVTLSSRGLDLGRNGLRDARPECLLPRAAVVDSETKSLLVTCYGIDAVIAYDATAANPLVAERRRWTVGAGPSGIAVDPEQHRAVVWSQFDRTIASFPILAGALVDEKASRDRVGVMKTALSPIRQPMPADYALGRILFHASGDTRISEDGRACASCHPDGRDDALTWATPEGPRRSIMLAGRVSTSSPYSWNGNEATLHDHLGNTFDRLSGKGLRSLELDALIAYVSRMPAPPRGTPARDDADVARGRAIFASQEAGCSSCHAGPGFHDGRSHDVGSHHKADRGTAFDTPSLRLVGGSGPYFHDGRYATLTELLTKTDGTMGHTSHLSSADRAALESYLRTL